MRLFVDEDASRGVLLTLLRMEHDVVSSQSAGLMGQSDPVQFRRAIREDRTLLSRNHDDFEDLHLLIRESRGHHPGVLIIRSDNNPRRDMTERGIVAAINKLIASRLPIIDEFHILNHWR